MAKLTQKYLESIRSEQHGESVRDDGNLSGQVRANKAGRISVSFTYRYRWDARTREISCGTWPKDTLAAVRKKRDDAKSKIQEGIDPRLARKALRLKLQSEENKVIETLLERSLHPTVTDLFNNWHQTEVSKRRDGGAEVKRAFTKDVLPMIGTVKAQDVSKADVMRIIDAVVARGTKRMPKQILADLRQMFGFAIDREIVHADPTARIKKGRIGGKDSVRIRHLSEAEIKELQIKLPSGKLTISTECALWIMLSTCCRVGEISRARWRDINFDNGTWIIPPEHAKNGRQLVVYLSEYSQSQFRRLETFKTNDVWMFPDRTGETHVNVKSISKQVGDRQRIVPMKNRSNAVATLKLSGGHWTPHDLRRTGATLMGGLGVRPDVLEKGLNHTEENKLTRTYQQQALKDEQREAWHLLGTRLAVVLGQKANCN